MSKQIKLLERPRTLDDLLRLYGQNAAQLALGGAVGAEVRWDYKAPWASTHFDCYWFDQGEGLSSICFALNKEDPLAYTPDGFLANPLRWDDTGNLRRGLLRLLRTVNPELAGDLRGELKIQSVLGQPLYDRENSQAVFRLTAATASTHALLRVSLENPQDSEKYQLFNSLEEALGELVVMNKVFYVVRVLGTGGDPRLFCIIEKTRLNLFPQEE